MATTLDSVGAIRDFLATEIHLSRGLQSEAWQKLSKSMLQKRHWEATEALRKLNIRDYPPGDSNNPDAAIVGLIEWIDGGANHGATTPPEENHGFYPATEILRLYKVPATSTTFGNRLMRWRNENKDSDGWRCVESPRQNQAKWLYRPSAVSGIIREYMDSAKEQHVARV